MPITSRKIIIFGHQNTIIMKILYYDCFAGISGDMNLGAMIDAGVPADYLIREISKLGVKGYSIEVSNSLKMGISGTKVTVHLEQKNDHAHKHHHHAQRNLNDIEKIISNSSLNSYIKTKSLAVFREIAQAEAKIHAKTIDEIHFHEVGAIDSIVDIVGAAICIDYLKPDKILSSAVELGGGLVICAHGTFPVPAPATAEILRNIPVKKGAVNQETTTPTGAAILKVFVNEFIDQIRFTINKVAYGLGQRDIEIPNVLRVFLGFESPHADYMQADALMIECNIDDMNPEQYDYIMNLLFGAGAQDVFLVPIIMKKSRPAIELKVLCDSDSVSEIERIMLHETTTLGTRRYPLTKSMLNRETKTIKTAYGPIRIKLALVSGKTIKFKAEYEDCAAAAKKNNISLQEVYREVERCVDKLERS